LTFNFGYRSFIGTKDAKSGVTMRNFAAFVSLSSQATYSRVSVANSFVRSVQTGELPAPWRDPEGP
jgi:hypothetical protein